MNSVLLSRRRLISLGGGLLAATSLPAIAAPALAQDEAWLAFRHLHTGETLRRVFWANGGFVEEHLAEIDHLLRDHRNGETRAIDRHLLILLYRLQQRLETQTPLQVISAYRSPATNAMLAARSNGVARKSLHLEGKAIDIRIPGIDLGQLRRAALALHGGGVGYYPASQFIHLDVGRVRQWG